jgi:hypothetical protein
MLHVSGQSSGQTLRTVVLRAVVIEPGSEPHMEEDARPFYDGTTPRSMPRPFLFD